MAEHHFEIALGLFFGGSFVAWVVADHLDDRRWWKERENRQ